MRQAGYVAPMGKSRNEYRDLAGETDKKSILKTEVPLGV
jgi:hypothetical protein